MVRKKVNLQWITHGSSRRATFRRRCKGLMKKAGELATLCRVKACVVVYGEGEARPEVWPSVPEARGVLALFKAMPEIKQWKKTVNQEEFLEKRIDMLQGQVSRSAHSSREIETACLLRDAVIGRRPGLVGASVEEIVSLDRMVDAKMRRAEKRLRQLVGRQGAFPEPEPPLHQQPPPPPPSLQPRAPYTSTQRLQHLVGGHGHGALLEPERLLPQQLQQASWSTPPPLVRYASTEVHGQAAVEEHQPQQQDWLMDMGQDGGDLGAVVHSALAGRSSGAGPRGSADVQTFGLSRSGSWDPLAPLE
ncbi:hypothetical protein ACP70R_030053 [Stipagrostis hirtigluma subsp. patula]